MQRQKIILIIGVVLAITAIVMINFYLEEQRQIMARKAQKEIETIQTNQVSVLVAKRDIPKGAAVSAEALEVSIVPNNFVQPQVVTSLDRISGMVTLAPILKGEQISLSKLTYPRSSGALSDATPVGKRAITVVVDNISSLVGMIKAGDYVDVIANLNIPVQGPDGKQALQGVVVPLFQNVLVLAVGQDTGAKERERYQKEGKDANPPITLALAPKEASIIAFVQEQGKIRLILRSPSDAQIEPLQPANWDTLFEYIMPREKQQLEDKKQGPDSNVGYVEVYRGLNKEKVPITQ